MKRLLLPAALLLAASSVLQAEMPGDRVRAQLEKILPPGMTVDAVAESPMADVYIVTVGSQELYVHGAGDFLLIGDVYDTVRQVSLGDERQNQRMADALAAVPEQEMVLMGEPTGRYVTVFTDTDCVYCQRFHLTVPTLQARGLQVRYLMFPRAGIGSASYREAVSVWCADDQAEAMTVAKAGGTVDPRSCDNPVAEQYGLGQEIGVRGTPTMILDTGEVIPGFVEPDELLERAGLSG